MKGINKLKNGKFRAKHKSIYLGDYDTETEAVFARWQSEIKHRTPGFASSSDAYLHLKESLPKRQITETIRQILTRVPTPPKHPISQARLKQILHYDLQTGVFTALKSRVGLRQGRPVGAVKNGYREVLLEGQRYRAGHLAFIYMEDYHPLEIEYRDGDTLNNTWRNIYDVGKVPRLRSSNASGITGVSAYKTKWRATIFHEGKQVFLGDFVTLARAAFVRWDAEDHFGKIRYNNESSAYRWLKENGEI